MHAVVEYEDKSVLGSASKPIHCEELSATSLLWQLVWLHVTLEYTTNDQMERNKSKAFHVDRLRIRD